METVNDRAGFLCNYEVLEVLRQQQQDRIKQLKELTGGVGGEMNGKRIGRYQDIAQREEAERIQPQDLHTVSWEAVQYLEADAHPMRRQTSAGVAKLLDGLDDYELTKSERLQIVNLAPQTLVELHVCIEDLAERYSDEQQEALLDLVRSHLGTAAPETATLPEVAAALPVSAADAPDLDAEPDEAAEIDEEMALIDEAYGGTRANEQVENDIDEVGES
ncbi:hypothetical protein JCM10908_002074 [Rhodotorula pacifica]|uniref:DNA-directed RNA polymerase III subunit RPC17 n=1 Tax=Rhodotorula pacifica TaxID=1495444 RepID=UPI00317024E5